MKRTNQIAALGILTLGLIVSSCGGETGIEKTAPDGETTEIKEDAVVEAPSFFGTYNMVNMIPVLGDKKLTPQDTKYIDETKTRTIDHTTLQLNEDGTFERIFPDPSGNGKTSKWTGTYKMDEAAKTLSFVALMNGQKMPIEFTIEEKSDNKLIIRSLFGQIYMDYVYSK